jgi:hypothetical protein
VCHVSLPSSYRSRQGHIHLSRVLPLVGCRSKTPTGPDSEAGLGAGSASVRYEGWAAPAIGAKRWSPWTALFLPLSTESIMPPRPSSSNIPSHRTSLLARAEGPICQDRDLLHYRPTLKLHCCKGEVQISMVRAQVSDAPSFQPLVFPSPYMALNFNAFSI